MLDELKKNIEEGEAKVKTLADELEKKVDSYSKMEILGFSMAVIFMILLLVWMF